MRSMRGHALVLAWLLVMGCSLDRTGLGGGGPRDASQGPGTDDAGVPVDGGDLDAGADDAGVPVDGGDLDAGADDAGGDDAGALDAGSFDAGSFDAGADDGGATDPGTPDAGVRDGGSVDAGSPDGGFGDRDAGAGCTTGLACRGDDLVACSASGSTMVVETCELGCVDTVTPPRCGRLAPSNVDDPTRIEDGSADLLVATGEKVHIDTDTGRIFETVSETERRPAGAAGDATGIVLAVVPQPAPGPELAVLSVRSLRVQPGGLLTASGARSLVILASDAVIVAGTIDVGGNGREPGPGGGAGGSPRTDGSGPGGGGRGGVAGLFGAEHGGGGGGGHAASGGGGGKHLFADGGSAGATIADPDGSPLIGGSGGGSGAPADGGGRGGGGGGAIQISSAVSIVVAGGAVIRAPGAGGGSGSRGGGGGGAGGTIFLEAPRVTVDGVLAANGGGGAGGTALSASANPGERGRDDAMRAAGGSRGLAGGAGGRGGAGATLAGESGNNGDAGGGGGGAAGRVRIRTATGASGGSGLRTPNASEGVASYY